MNRIITIGREFGSGGRELGLRLAEELHIAYYDREILSAITERTSFSEEYIRQFTEQRPFPVFPITIGRSFYPSVDPLMEQSLSIYQQQGDIIRELAGKSDCVIVGRCADCVLKEWKPLRIFVYAEMAHKMARCREKEPQHEHFSDKELRQHILAVDKGRAKYYEFYTGQAWGAKQNYDLCVNTTNIPIEEIAIGLANLVK